jgi:hypothetical protein
LEKTAMKKIVFILLGIALVILAIAASTYAVDTNKNRIEYMNPVAHAVHLGYMLDQINAIFAGGEVLTSTVTLAAGTSDTAKVLIGAHTLWSDGLFYSIPATELAFTATTHDCANGKWRTYRISMEPDSTGVITHAASTYSTKALAVAALPACPAGDIDLGYICVYANGALFDASTTKLNAATLIVTYIPATNYVKDLD